MPLVGPPNAGDVRRVVEERLDALDKGLQETITIEWRGQPRSLPVIQMPVQALAYNPNTHRVRAQRSLDADRDKALDSAPYGAVGQAYLHSLLMGSPSDPSKIDPSFEALKEDLREHGQNDPGIISRSGVLINGNTRRAALTELGEEHIRVGVLPQDAALEDLQSIELALQLRKDHRRDYSFMNLLLAIDERVEAGRSAADVQRDFRIQAKTFEKYRWILQFVREAIERSKISGQGGVSLSMRLVDFEDDQGQLEELYRAYSSLKSKSPDDADAMLEQRLLAMTLDKSKTDLRLIDSDFAKRYMKALIPEVSVVPTLKIPGTNISAAGPSRQVAALRSLTTGVLQARSIELSPGSVSADKLDQAGQSLKAIDSALESALVKAGKNSRITKKRYAAADRLSDAVECVDLAIAAVADARATGNFDPEDLDDSLGQLHRNLGKLAQIVARSATISDRPGLEWLRSAASLPDSPT